MSGQLDCTVQHSSLCEACLDYFHPLSFLKAISLSDTTNTASVTFSKRRSNLADTAGRCEICKLILSNAHTFDNETPTFLLEFTMGDETHDIKRVRLSYQSPLPEDTSTGPGPDIVALRDFIVHALPGDPAGRFIKNRPIEVDVGSSRSIDTAKSWLQQCCIHHPSCNPSGKMTMPTRCLKVDSLTAISLSLTKSQQHPYAALSYCWGPKQFPNLVTTRNSFNDRLENIPLTAFPPTLRDGILVTHQLGIRYLWIDALCIIQDDDHDKDNEIPQMRQIFANAYCTIIAATAAHCHAGFLHTRELPRVSELCVPYPGPGAKDGLMILRPHEPDEWVLYDPLDDPVNDRAWTLEERLLSPRRLIYSKNHLRWLCETAEYTNGGDLEDRRFVSASKRHTQMERLPPQLSPRVNPFVKAADTVTDDRETWYAWLLIVREYNIRSLTKSKDKLRAIGGIAELYQLRTGDQYCAGLWRRHLAEELLWIVDNPRATFRTMLAEANDPTGSSVRTVGIFPRPRYRAPTWSWASVDGMAANHRMLTTSRFIADVFEVIDCVVVPERPNAPLTGVRSAVLTVRGRLKPAYVQTDSLMLYESEEACQRQEYFGTCHLDAVEHEPYPNPRPVYCLEITSRISHGWAGNQQGITLVDNADSQGVFHRVGGFGTDSLHDNWFAEIEPRIVKIT